MIKTFQKGILFLFLSKKTKRIKHDHISIENPLAKMWQKAKNVK